MRKTKLVMVGNGMAGMRTIEELLKVAPALYDISVFGAEPHPNYNRILLSPVLAGEQTLDEIVLNSWEWYEENTIALHAGKKVIEVDRVLFDSRYRAAGRRIELDHDVVGGDNVTGLDVDGFDASGVLRAQRVMHLHGFDHGQRGARRDLLADRDLDGDDGARHRGAHGAVLVHLTD